MAVPIMVVSIVPILALVRLQAGVAVGALPGRQLRPIVTTHPIAILRLINSPHPW